MKDSERYRYSDATPGKQHFLDGFTRMWAGAFNGIRRKHRKAKWFKSTPIIFDLFAGPGIDPTGQPGSPLIIAKALRQSGVGYFELNAYEADSETCNSLRSAASTDGNIYVFNADNSLVTERLYRYDNGRYGFVYVDPSTPALPIDTLTAICNVYPKMDILINIAGNSRKRMAHLPGYIPLNEQFQKLGKRTIRITDGKGKLGWTFVCLSNWTAFPEWEKENFVNWETDRGQDWFDELVYTKQQRHDKIQPRLFDDDKSEDDPKKVEPPYRTYDEYLKHPTFKAIRWEAMVKANWMCQRCKQRRATEVHHLRYPKWGTFDTVDNLLPVCNQCHCDIHGKVS